MKIICLAKIEFKLYFTNALYAFLYTYLIINNCKSHSTDSKNPIQMMNSSNTCEHAVCMHIEYNYC